MTSLLLAASSSDRTCGNGSQPCQGRFSLDTGQHFFTERVVKHWKRLPREGLKAPALSVFGQHPEFLVSPKEDQASDHCRPLPAEIFYSTWKGNKVRDTQKVPLPGMRNVTEAAEEIFLQESLTKGKQLWGAASAPHCLR